jgi:hypothetical protein
MIQQLYTQSALAIGATEVDLTSGTGSIATNTDAGLVQLMLDLGNLVTGDVFELRRYEKARSGGTQRGDVVKVFTGAQPANTFYSLQEPLSDGWAYTLKRTSANNRNVDVSVRVLS